MWSTLEINKYLTFNPRSTQNRKFQEDGKTGVSLSKLESSNIYHVDVGKSNFWIGQSLLSILQSLTHTVNYSTWMLVGAICIISSFSFWKLDYLSDMTCFKNPLFDMIHVPANHIRCFSMILESDINPRYIHWTLTPFQLEKFQLKFHQNVCFT